MLSDVGWVLLLLGYRDLQLVEATLIPLSGTKGEMASDEALINGR